VSPNRRLATIVSCLVIVSLIVAQGSGNRAQLGESRSVSLPSHAILDENSQPLISASGKTGFVSSVTGGSLISFSATSGKMLSSMVVGETIGPITMVESNGRRLIAVPALNDPGTGNPATVSIIDAARPRELDLRALLVLPEDAVLTPSTRALLSEDGKFCFIAVSFNEPALLSFDVEAGALVSRLPLLARPSDAALYDRGGARRLAVASSVSNELTLIKADDQGRLVLLDSFSPDGARFDDSNNPAFSSDGKTVYIAASTGDKLFAVDSDSGALSGSAPVPSARRVTVAATDSGDVIGVTRASSGKDDKTGGVTVVIDQGGQLAVRSQFTAPDGIELSRSNNVVFGEGASVGFVASATGLLFAFNTQTGEVESQVTLGSELRRIAVSEKSKTVMAIKSSSGGDEIVILPFDKAAADEASSDESAAPVITSLSPDKVEQSRPQNLKVTVTGTNFTKESTLLVGEGDAATEISARLIRNKTALEATIRKALLAQPRELSIRVKAAGGLVSNPSVLRVIGVGPVIDKIKPGEIPGPARSFTLRVIGKNFRPTSQIHVNGQKLNTQFSATELQAVVPRKINGVRLGRLHQLKVKVQDMIVTELVSEEKTLEIFGPRISKLGTRKAGVIAGAGSFALKITGENFRPGARVKISGQKIGDKLIPSAHIIFLGDKQIKLRVPGRYSASIGDLSVSVVNPGTRESNVKGLTVVGPEVSEALIQPARGDGSRRQVVIKGKNFLPGAVVEVVTRGIDSPHRRTVPFKFFPDRIVIVLPASVVSGIVQLAREFRVANPGNIRSGSVKPDDDDTPGDNNGPAITAAVIERVAGDATRRRIVITGRNFRSGTMIEFIKSGAVSDRKPPATVTSTRLEVFVSESTLVDLGQFQLRVSNPGDRRSNEVTPTLENAQTENEND